MNQNQEIRDYNKNQSNEKNQHDDNISINAGLMLFLYRFIYSY